MGYLDLDLEGTYQSLDENQKEFQNLKIKGLEILEGDHWKCPQCEYYEINCKNNLLCYKCIFHIRIKWEHVEVFCQSGAIGVSGRLIDKLIISQI